MAENARKLHYDHYLANSEDATIPDASSLQFLLQTDDASPKMSKVVFAAAAMASSPGLRPISALLGS